MRWEALVPIAGGRHCSACRKTVIDVERLTSAEVDALVESGEPACVRVATLPDGSVLTRDHPRAPRRATAWAGVALAASAISCSESIGEEEVGIRGGPEIRESPRPARALAERASSPRAIEVFPVVGVDPATLATTVGGLGGIDLEYEVPPWPAFDPTTPVSGSSGMADEAVYVLGGIGGSGVAFDEVPLPILSRELD